MKEWIPQLLEGEPLTAAQAEAAFDRLMRGAASEAEAAAFLTALRVRGETPSEVAGGVRALRKAMVPVVLPEDRLVDTCGTGGGRLTTFNISTAAALVAAGGGVGVAKHGNRSFTSRCGSADVLEALGVAIELPPERLPEVFAEAGLVFMMAPRFHPAMRHVGPVRRALGTTTIMNVLGPLTNPARVRRQVVGVAEPALLRLVAEALAELGHERAMVVHGEPGLDELSPLGPTRMLLVEDGRVEERRAEPAAFGWVGLDAAEIAGGSPAENAARIRAVLAGELRGAARAAVVLNAAAAFWAAGKAEDLEEGVAAAEASLDSGAAREALERLRAATARHASSSAEA